MKTLFSLALAASLILNLALLFAVTRGSAGDDAEIAAASPDSGPNSSGVTEPRIDANVWPALDSSDLRTLADRLRASGFPPDVVRAIVAAQVNELFAARRRAIDPSGETRAFWKTVNLDPAVAAAQRELRREQSKLLRDILGTDPETSTPFGQAREKRQFGNLGPEKIAELREIVRDFSDRRNAVYGPGGGSIGVTEREKIVALEREQREAIRAVLTPEEFLDYELRNSTTASILRNELSAFDPTEEEFRKIFAVRQAFDEQFHPMGFNPNTSQDEMRRRTEAQQKLTEEIKAALGSERGATYERATDFNYRRASQLVARLELPPETTDQLYAIQKEFEQRRNEMMRGGMPPSREAMTERLNALHAEAIAKLTPVLRTPTAVDAYKEYGGTWLRSLAPPPPRTR